MRKMSGHGWERGEKHHSVDSGHSLRGSPTSADRDEAGFRCGCSSVGYGCVQNRGVDVGYNYANACVSFGDHCGVLRIFFQSA